MASNQPTPPKRVRKRASTNMVSAATSSPSDMLPAERARNVGRRSVHRVTAGYIRAVNPCPFSWHAQLGLFPR
eukprot:6752166-Pyramimonas_sp.AAC.1